MFFLKHIQNKKHVIMRDTTIIIHQSIDVIQHSEDVETICFTLGVLACLALVGLFVYLALRD